MSDMTDTSPAAVEPTKYDMSIHSNPDAAAWAAFFKATFPDSDEGLMHVWFANAMMAMHDHMRAERDAAVTRANAERDAALVEAADIIRADNYDDPDSAADAILALRDKPAPAATALGAARVLLNASDMDMPQAAKLEANRVQAGIEVTSRPVVISMAALRAIAGYGDE